MLLRQNHDETSASPLKTGEGKCIYMLKLLNHSNNVSGMKHLGGEQEKRQECIQLLEKTYKPVISFEDDVHIWAYLDHQAGLLRYEAYVVGYNEKGDQSTLEFVLKEGIIGTIQEIGFLKDLYQEKKNGRLFETPVFSQNGRCLTMERYSLYSILTQEQISSLHGYFDRIESDLKKEMQTFLILTLKHLGYDVIDRL
jgi:hypothetical protein